MLYLHAYCKKSNWFDEVVLIVWGPSTKLLSESPILQKSIKQMMGDGVVVQACLWCANQYGVENQLEEMGIEVKGMGLPLSDYLKDGWKVLSF